MNSINKDVMLHLQFLRAVVAVNVHVVIFCEHQVAQYTLLGFGLCDLA